MSPSDLLVLLIEDWLKTVRFLDVYLTMPDSLNRVLPLPYYTSASAGGSPEHCCWAVDTIVSLWFRCFLFCHLPEFYFPLTNARQQEPSLLKNMLKKCWKLQ